MKHEKNNPQLVEQPGVQSKAKNSERRTSSSYAQHLARTGLEQPVSLISRYNLPAEKKVLEQMLRAMTPDMRRMLNSIQCDSKATCVWVAELWGRDEATAEKIAGTMEHVALMAHGGHNGVIVNNGGHQVVRPGWWREVKR